MRESSHGHCPQASEAHSVPDWIRKGQPRLSRCVRRMSGVALWERKGQARSGRRSMGPARNHMMQQPPPSDLCPPVRLERVGSRGGGDESSGSASATMLRKMSAGHE